MYNSLENICVRFSIIMSSTSQKIVCRTGTQFIPSSISIYLSHQSLQVASVQQHHPFVHGQKGSASDKPGYSSDHGTNVEGAENLMDIACPLS